MREIARPVVRALRLAGLALAMTGLAFAMAALSSGEVLAQAKQAPPKQAAPAQPAPPPPQQEAPLKQIALTEAQVASVLAATKEMDPVTEKIPDDGKPDPKLTAQLDGIAKKNGFASYDDYNIVVDNINLVLGGFDHHDQEICRRRSGHPGADRRGPGRQENVGQGQEGSAGRSQRRAEIAGAGGREQGQYRPRDQILRQARRSAVRARNRSAIRGRDRIKAKKAPEKSPGLFYCLSIAAPQVLVRIRIMKLS